MSEQEPEPSNMERLRAALNAGQRVEIRRLSGGISGTLSAAQEHAEYISEENARGERAARIVDESGEREFGCRVTRSEAHELLDAGAVEA